MRHSDGTWQSFWDDVQQLIRPIPMIQTPVATACAADSSGQLHLCVIDAQGGIWHTIRGRGDDGKWLFQFVDVQQQIINGGHPAIGPVSAVACAINNLGQLHVMVLDTAGRLWHTIRLEDGTWPFAFGDVQGQTNLIGPNPGIGPLSSIACANEGNRLHVCVVDVQTKALWHTIRQQNGTWPFRFDDVQTQAGLVAASMVPPGVIAQRSPIGAIACGATAKRLHVLAVTRDDVQFVLDAIMGHTIREFEGTWQPFGSVTQQLGLPRGMGGVSPVQFNITSN